MNTTSPSALTTPLPTPSPVRSCGLPSQSVSADAAADKGCMDGILIVDDHPLTREALAALLEPHGFDVVGEAADGEEAIERARELRPELVLLDLTMPGMDGLDGAAAHARGRARDARSSC